MIINKTGANTLEAPHEDKLFKGQLQQVFLAFYKQPKTMLTVSVETGILRANICRYVGKWRKTKSIATINKGICPISKSSGVQFLSTDPGLISNPAKTDKL